MAVNSTPDLAGFCRFGHSITESIVLSNDSGVVREMVVQTGEREAIGQRLAEAVGKRSPAVIAAEMGISRPRLLQIQAGQIPNAWLYLARLARKGVDVNHLLTGE